MILDYAGGTYVAQTNSADERVAFGDWLRQLRSASSVNDKFEEVAQAFETASNGGLTPLNGLTSVWCATASSAKGLALMNVVATAS